MPKPKQLAAPRFRLLPSEVKEAQTHTAAVVASIAVLRLAGRNMARTLRRIYRTHKAASEVLGVSTVYWSWIATGRQVPSNDLLLRMAETIEKAVKDDRKGE